MQPLRHRINPKIFVITLRQIAKHLKIQQERILNGEKWHNVLWIHIQGLGGYFVSYRKLTLLGRSHGFYQTHSTT
ncbi:MAG TPA: hypothetical protein V6D14_30835 [Coleofasciculaceae cyanobacterium]